VPVIIELCGGPAEGQIIELYERPMQYRVPVLRSYPSYWKPDAGPFIPRDPYDVVLYLDTNIYTREGYILYATPGLFEQLRMVGGRQAACDNSAGHPNEQVPGN
jgi:hypothetical protein